MRRLPQVLHVEMPVRPVQADHSGLDPRLDVGGDDAVLQHMGEARDGKMRRLRPTCPPGRGMAGGAHPLRLGQLLGGGVDVVGHIGEALAGRGIDRHPHAMALAGLDDVAAAEDIGFHRLAHHGLGSAGLADRGEVEDHVGPRLAESGIEGRHVADIGGDAGALAMVRGDIEVEQRGRPEALQQLAQPRADGAGTAGDQDPAPGQPRRRRVAVQLHVAGHGEFQRVLVQPALGCPGGQETARQDLQGLRRRRVQAGAAIGRQGDDFLNQVSAALRHRINRPAGATCHAQGQCGTKTL